MIRSSIILMIITIISKLLGFIRDILLSYFYGASGISDAYLISQTIPDTFFMTVGAAISTSFIPIYSRLRRSGNNNKEEEFTNNLVNTLSVLGLFISFLGIIFAPHIVRFFASGFQGEVFKLTVSLTRISFIGLTFTIVTSLFTSYLQANNEFIISGSIGIPLNLIIFIFIIISSYTSPIYLGIGSVIAHVLQLIYLIPIIVKKGYRHEFIINLNDTSIKRVYKMSIPVILGVSINQLNIIIGRTIASGIIIGGVSTLSYASRITGFLQSILVTTILTIVYPTLSQLAASLDKKFSQFLFNTLSIISFLTIPATVGIIIFSNEIIELLFGRGDFTVEAVNATSDVLVYYSIGLFALGIQQVLSRAYYSLNDTKTPAINALVGLLLNILLSLLLSRLIGLNGVAISYSITTIVISTLLFIKLRNELEDLKIYPLLINILKIFFASLIMGFLTNGVYNILLEILPQTLSLFVAIIFGVFIYFVLAYLFRLKESERLINLLKSKFSI